MALLFEDLVLVAEPLNHDFLKQIPNSNFQSYAELIQSLSLASQHKSNSSKMLLLITGIRAASANDMTSRLFFVNSITIKPLSLKFLRNLRRVVETNEQPYA